MKVKNVQFATMATTLAEKGLRALLAERKKRFRNRIRGDWLAPWGGAGARMLGL